MILQKSPDGRTLGYYNQFGFWTALISAIPAIINMANPQQVAPPPPPPPPSNLPLILGAGLGGLMMIGGVVYLLKR